MKRTRSESKEMSKQVKARTRTVPEKPVKVTYEGNADRVISTGSTLLDLAISGGRVRGGGIPAGILVEIFGPSQSGKTVLLSEIAGNVQEQGGEVMFHDPEARLNKQFASLFGLKIKEGDYSKPNTVTEVFSAVRSWNPGSTKAGLIFLPNPKIVNGVFADSLAALSTDLEMEEEEGDKMGMRRAKEFSQELRRTCRILAEKNLLMVCSNQIRQDLDVVHGRRYKSPGGEAIGFYSSLRLKTQFAMRGARLHKTIKVAGKEIKKVIGVTVDVDVFKSSIWKPHGTAPVTIIFDYGIDDIRQNLQFIKTYTKATTYVIGGDKLATGMEESIAMIEEDNLEETLQEEVIDLWEEIEKGFKSDRKPKKQ